MTLAAPKTLPILIIPAYQPGPNLVELVRELRQMPYQSLIVVNDGSQPEKDFIFKQLEEIPGVTCLTHAVNLGKGQALKTAFNWALLRFPKASGVVTLDADGQHTPRDVLKVALALEEAPQKLILGAREFSKEVPLRSRFGNILTRHVFAFFLGRRLRDTQTGLRGLPLAFLKPLLQLKSTGYEFELDMLVLASRLNLGLREVAIETVYEPGNPTSHFNPLLDSAKIYFVFIRFSLSAVLTALLDYLVFTLVFMSSSHILLSTVAARLVAGPFNFYLGRKLVFRSTGRPAVELALYSSLVFVTLGFSYLLVKTLVELFQFHVYTAKIIAEGTLFLASFAIQRTLIFSTRNKQNRLERDTLADQRLELFYQKLAQTQVSPPSSAPPH